MGIPTNYGARGVGIGAALDSVAAVGLLEGVVAAVLGGCSVVAAVRSQEDVDCSRLVDLAGGEAVEEGVLEGVRHTEEAVGVEEDLGVGVLGVARRGEDRVGLGGRLGMPARRRGPVAGLREAWGVVGVEVDGFEAGNAGTLAPGYSVVRRMDCTRRNTGRSEDLLV